MPLYRGNEDSDDDDYGALPVRTKPERAPALTGRTLYVSRDRPTILERNHQILNNAWTERNKFQLLGIAQNHGGMFTFTQVVQLDDLRISSRDLPSSARHPKVEHIRQINKDHGQIQFIGTKGCGSCVAIYFEIEHQRCFFAHRNAQRFIDLYRSGGDRDYRVATAVTGRLRSHAKYHGWKRQDVKKETIVAVCPNPGLVGDAIVRGLQVFLTGDEKAPGPQIQIYQAHGFIVAPGARKSSDLLRFQVWSPPLTITQASKTAATSRC